MKNIALVAALVLSTTIASVRVAAACGGTGQPPQGILGTATVAAPKTATGVHPRLERKDGRTILTLAYPGFDGQRAQVYVDYFEVVRDRNLRRLENMLAHRRAMSLDVTVERVDGHRWRVIGWATRA